MGLIMISNGIFYLLILRITNNYTANNEDASNRKIDQ